MLTNLSTIVTEVGRLLSEWRKAGRVEGKWEGPHQFKAQADEMAHRELVTRLQALDPHLPIVSEEDLGSQREERPQRYWLIDPIDGTASFAQGYDGFVTQVALIEEQAPSVAAIFAPAYSQLFTAERGRGAWRDGERLQVNPGAATTLIDNFPKAQGVAALIFQGLKLTRYLESGSIALKICRVADQTADLFVKDVPVRDWDLAPAHLVLEEAGGKLTDGQGKAVAYAGTFVKPGVVAANSDTTYQRWFNWYRGENGG
jgi:3'(2'), 5'-bisphosphate nucleotidase